MSEKIKSKKKEKSKVEKKEVKKDAKEEEKGDYCIYCGDWVPEGIYHHH
ncbi:MAG: hypothetical protein ACTSUV_03385 [Candidatus Ranarchaeia archaeon]